jgi:hypothetical protein
MCSMNDRERQDLIKSQFLALEEKDAEIRCLQEEVSLLKAKLHALDTLFAGGHGIEAIDALAERFIERG